MVKYTNVSLINVDIMCKLMQLKWQKKNLFSLCLLPVWLFTHITQMSEKQYISWPQSSV